MEINPKYLTFAEYNSVGGNLSENQFKLLEFEAEKIVDKLTFGRLIGDDDIIIEIKLCVKSIIDLLVSYSNSENNKNISSESIDGYSISYITSSQIQETIKSKNAEIEDIVRNYLANVVDSENVPLLYRG